MAIPIGGGMVMKKKKLVRFDWAMKYILRNKANFDVLEGFLSNLLKEDIHIQSLLESESNQEDEKRKFNRVDLLCTDGQGRQIIIEVQNQREVDYLERLLWGTSKAIVENLELGKPYKEITKVISISILYFPISHNQEYLYKGQTDFLGVHTQEPLMLHGKSLTSLYTASVHTNQVFPEYYLIDVERFEDIINEEIDEWIYFFKHGEIQEDFKSPGILLASQRLDFLAMSEKDRKAYESYLAYLASEQDIIETAIAKGVEQGVQQGLEQGILQEKQATVQRLLAKGVTIADISDITGLSVNDIVAKINNNAK